MSVNPLGPWVRQVLPLFAQFFGFRAEKPGCILSSVTAGISGLHAVMYRQVCGHAGLFPAFFGYERN